MTLEEILMSEDVVLNINNNLDSLLEIIPELESMFNFDQLNIHHHLNLWDHTLCALSYSPNIFNVRLALLLHDIGKTKCYVEVDGFRHYGGHPNVSAQMSEEILNRLDLEEKQKSEILYLIRYHDDPITKKDVLKSQYISYERYLIQECDAYAHKREELSKRMKYIKKTRKLIFGK